MWLVGRGGQNFVFQESEPQCWEDVFSDLLTLETRFCIFACFCFVKAQLTALTIQGHARSAINY